MTQNIWSHRRTAEVVPSKCAVAADGRVLKYSELVVLVDKTASALRKLGVRPGDVVSTDLPVGPELFALVLACLEQGFGCFPVPLKTMLTGSDQEVAQVALHVTNAPAEGGSQLRFEELLEYGDGSGNRTGSSAGFVIYATSGTTGIQRVADKRPLKFPYRGVPCYDKYGAGVGYGLHLMTNPSYHRGTLGPALYSLQAGSGVVVMRRFSPESFVEHIDEYQVDSTFLMSGRIRSVLDCEAQPRHRMRSFQHGATSCPVEVKQSAIERFGPVLHEYYATADLMISEIGTAEWTKHVGSVGRPLPGVQVRVVRADGAEATPGQDGEITVRPGLAERKHATDSGFVRTGDAGYVSESGHVYVIGRVASDGQTKYASIERMIRSLPEVSDAAVISTEDAVHCRVERAEPAAAEDGLLLRVKELVEGAWPEATYIDIRPSGSFNRTESGKLRRIVEQP